MTHKTALLYPVVFFILMIAGVSCQPGNETEQESGFYYFPEKNVYYDSRNAQYYFSLDSAKTWDSLRYARENFGAALGAKVVIDRPTPAAWSENNAHRDEYNGVLLNLVNSRTLLLGREDSVKKSRKLVVAKPRPIADEAEVEETDERPKKGIKKFFDKLFGKKKDKKEE
jgi:hypothetical protein